MKNVFPFHSVLKERNFYIYTHTHTHIHILTVIFSISEKMRGV